MISLKNTIKYTLTIDGWQLEILIIREEESQDFCMHTNLVSQIHLL